MKFTMACFKDPQCTLSRVDSEFSLKEAGLNQGLVIVPCSFPISCMNEGDRGLGITKATEEAEEEAELCKLQVKEGSFTRAFLVV